jgi:hypothetical protein
MEELRFQSWVLRTWELLSVQTLLWKLRSVIGFTGIIE